MKCDELKDRWFTAYPVEGDQLIEVDVYGRKEVDEAIDELKAENERLKKCEIWMMQHFYCEEVIACESAKNRKLQRALWLARAERAKEMCQRMLIQGFDPKWENVERKCRAKAEKYK